MSLVSCPECGKQVSDLSPSCIHCGCPFSSSTETTSYSSGDHQNSSRHRSDKVEVLVRQGVDVLFGFMYIYLVYMLFFDGNTLDIEDEAVVLGLAIGFAILCFVQTLVRSVLGTIAKTIDVLISGKS
ncbi:hypothetical protein [Pseudoalteromonas rubra]|uniref:hypothetical protein n=1 Tax=Pseudoalteromonas rubra TaxID=43658 RepID=UPI002DBBE1E5|nr:hypothetical protein [Pseudoalteromonas rubra]MEC4090384.1 hypothetical protein [Pseudoalteromonas rubra]